MSAGAFTPKKTIASGLYGGSGLCYCPQVRGIIVISWEESLIRRINIDSGNIFDLSSTLL